MGENSDQPITPGVGAPDPGGTEVIDRSLRGLATQLVAGPLQEPIARTDLPAQWFVEEAVAHEDEITIELASAWGHLADLRLQLEKAKSRRSAQIGGPIILALAFAAAWIASILHLPEWFVLTIGGFGGILGLTPLLTTIREMRVRRRGSSSSSTAFLTQTRAVLEEQLQAAEIAYQPALERELLAWLSERVDREIGEIYLPMLPELDPQGLAEVDDSEREIPTRAGTELGSLIERMPGGSIGLSGPRGAGKTTLIRRMTIDAERVESDRVSTGIVVDAPVDYDAREFVLHLFAKLCETVLGTDRVDTLRGAGQGLGSPNRGTRPFRSLRSSLPPLLGPGLIAIGGGLYIAVRYSQGDIKLADAGAWALVLMAIGGLLTYSTLILNLPWTAARIRGLLPLRSRGKDPFATAELRLRQIWFQRTFSSGWSGALKIPVGFEAAAERNTQLAENQLSFPDVVSLYKEFVRMLTPSGEVRIGIDELDKMDDERARRFLNEIKVIFRISGCFYLVSVSEDAMSYFERRGLPFRDVFDSSFDDVLRVGYLRFDDSHRLLRRRVIGLPIQFAALCHILGGGLARDVIRTARDVCEHQDESSLEAVTHSLSIRQLRSKCAAAQVAIRRLQDPKLILPLSSWLSRIDVAAADIESLWERCKSFEGEVASSLFPEHESGELTEHREALSIALEVMAFAYFVITLEQFMPSLDSEDATKRAIDNLTVDRLAEARQAFSIGPGEAWETISFVRSNLLMRDIIVFPGVATPSAAGSL